MKPAVALLLGAAIASEPLDAARLGACAITALAVVFVIRARGKWCGASAGLPRR
ncbi:MAG TPA: hypothetical protein VFX59_30145 [Polyangiales bacterium]|nr:hypothetical protein [Polyangiales bacterium]